MKRLTKENTISYVLNWNCIIFSLICFLSLMLCVLYKPDFRDFDMQILNCIKGSMAAFPIIIPTAISEFGKLHYFMWPQITLGVVLLSHKKYFKAFLSIAIIQVCSLSICVLKNYVCRERPCVYEGYSFPSAHAMMTICIYGIMAYLILYYVKNKFWKYFLVTIIYIFIFAVAFSRLWLGVHFPSDVLAGLALGFCFVNLFIIISKSVPLE